MFFGFLVWSALRGGGGVGLRGVPAHPLEGPDDHGRHLVHGHLDLTEDVRGLLEAQALARVHIYVYVLTRATVVIFCGERHFGFILYSGFLLGHFGSFWVSTGGAERLFGETSYSVMIHLREGRRIYDSEGFMAGGAVKRVTRAAREALTKPFYH